jgi:hypothetical protein
MIHLYWPGAERAICGLETTGRNLAQIQYSLHAGPEYQPYRRHWTAYCPECLRGVEVGPSEYDGNRAQPIKVLREEVALIERLEHDA